AMAWWSGRAPGTAPIGRRDARLLSGLGFIGYYLSSLLDFLGLQYVTASLERLMLFLYPTIVVVLSAIFLAQPITRRTVAALALSYGGIAIAVAHDIRFTGDAHAIALGATLVFSSAVGYAIYLVAAGGIIARPRLVALHLLGDARVDAVRLASVRADAAVVGARPAAFGASADARDGRVLHRAADVDDRRIDPPHRRQHRVAGRLARSDFHDRLRRRAARRTRQPLAVGRRRARPERCHSRLAQRPETAGRSNTERGPPKRSLIPNTVSKRRQKEKSMAPDTIERAMLELSDPSLLRQQCYVDGAWIDADDRGSMPVVDPATGGLVGTAPMFGAAETRRAIAAAERAFPAWRAKTAKERGAVLRRWNDLMLANVDDLARILTTEQGKPITESKGEITIGAAYVEWFAEEAKRVYGDVLPTIGN